VYGGERVQLRGGFLGDSKRRCDMLTEARLLELISQARKQQEARTPKLTLRRTEWIYRATAKNADWGVTDDCLTNQGFLWRTAYKKKNKRGVPQLIPNVSSVTAGDLIHVAFSRNHRGRTVLEGLGTFEVLADAHPDSEEPVEAKHGQLTLFRVRRGSPLEEILDETSYTRDPLLQVYVGWHVREVPGRAIEFTKEMFRGHNALQDFSPPMAVGQVAGSPPFHAARTVLLPESGSALGVDWSGSAQAGRKVWAARLEFGQAEARLASLWQPFAGGPARAADVAARFAGWLEGQTFDVAGLDFCFGVARQHALPGMPRTGPAALGLWIEEQYTTPEDFRAALGTECRRETDRVSGSPFAPMNLRMYRQTYWGLRALAGLRIPILPWGAPGDRSVIEILPAHVARILCPGCRYKGRTGDAREARRQLLGTVRSACHLRVSPETEQAILADHEGDALDAVLAGIAAGAAKRRGFADVPDEAAQSGEGWIYSV
jgi:hypothetical protein